VKAPICAVFPAALSPSVAVASSSGGRCAPSKTVELAPQLGDLEALARDGRRVVGGPGASQCQLGIQRLDIIGRRIHEAKESQSDVGCSFKLRLTGTFRPNV
jgi:hypothetical protein